jgi:hydrogenase nickel incorporation protein HypA/HybF
MHEHSLMRGLMRTIETVTREQGASRATVIRVKLGALSHMSPEHFMEHFREASRGTLAEAAHVEIQTSDDFTCPQAQDVVLESLELEVDEA